MLVTWFLVVTALFLQDANMEAEMLAALRSCGLTLSDPTSCCPLRLAPASLWCLPALPTKVSVDECETPDWWLYVRVGAVLC